MKEELKFKLCIFGDFAVGKTTLAHRYLTTLFRGTVKVTLGMEIHVKELEMEGHQINLQIWDFGGQRRFKYLLPAYARGSFGGIFMYDISNEDSLTELDDWMDHFYQGLREDISLVPLLLVGGKSDLKMQREVKLEDAKKFQAKYKFIDVIAQLRRVKM